MPTLSTLRPEPPRTRQHGTRVHQARTADEAIAACQDVVANGYAKINHCMVDATTAGAICTLWDALNPTNRDVTRAFWLKWQGRGDAAGDPRLALHKLVKLTWKFIH